MEDLYEWPMQSFMDFELDSLTIKKKTIIEVTSIFNPFELIHISRKKLKVEG